MPQHIRRRAASIETYLRELRRHSLLTVVEERELARASARGDPHAAQRLVAANLRFVVRIAAHYGVRSQDVSDFIQEGNVGLVKAAQRFDPERGTRFISYAAPWIRAQIQRYRLRAYSVVAPPTKRSRIHPQARDRDQSFDLLVGDEIESTSRGPSVLQDGAVSAAQEQALHERGVSAALLQLDKRERLIAEERLMSDPPMMLTSLAARFEISCERTRQLELRAKRKLRKSLLGLAAETQCL